MTWTMDEIRNIGEAEEMDLASLRRDGTVRKPVTIWVIRVGDDLYVRSWKGRTSWWFRGIEERHEGRIEAGGVGKDVRFVAEPDRDINDRIDKVYRTKYRQHGDRWVDPMVAALARDTTIKLVPR